MFFSTSPWHAPPRMHTRSRMADPGAAAASLIQAGAAALAVKQSSRKPPVDRTHESVDLDNDRASVAAASPRTRQTLSRGQKRRGGLRRGPRPALAWGLRRRHLRPRLGGRQARPAAGLARRPCGQARQLPRGLELSDAPAQLRIVRLDAHHAVCEDAEGRVVCNLLPRDAGPRWLPARAGMPLHEEADDSPLSVPLVELVAVHEEDNLDTAFLLS